MKTETMEIQGCKATIQYATDKGRAVSLRSIEEMLLAALLHEPCPHLPKVRTQSRKTKIIRTHSGKE